MNEAADLVALVAKLKEDHTKELEERDMKHAADMSKLTEQIKNLSASLETVAKNSKEQHDSMSHAVRTAEEKLASHADEMTALHDHVLGKLSTCRKCYLLVVVENLLLTLDFSSFAAPANLSDAEGSSSRLECILQVGEIISATASAAKFFPGNSNPVDLDQTASMLTQATEEHDNVLRSAACGGVDRKSVV